VVGHQARRLVDAESLMLDLLYVVIIVVFFLLALAYVAACERLE
jgi:nitric oxide reductase large subunit